MEKKLMFVNLPHSDARPLPAFVLSNTCDIDPSNERLYPTRIVYAPIFQLEKYRNALIEDHVKIGRYKQEKIDAHIEAIKKQFISHILFLPKGYGLMHDSIVFFDRLNNCPLDTLNSKNLDSKNKTNERLFSLSDYGFYLFLVKLSIHFTRIREKVKRS
jgi:hypothetical protein